MDKDIDPFVSLSRLILYYTTILDLSTDSSIVIDRIVVRATSMKMRPRLLTVTYCILYSTCYSQVQ